MQLNFQNMRINMRVKCETKYAFLCKNTQLIDKIGSKIAKKAFFNFIFGISIKF